MGGGEKHMAAIAEFLSRIPSVRVDIVTHAGEVSDLERLSTKLRVDLSRCRLRFLNELPCDIETLSESYDVFINATHYSSVKPRAKKNVLLCFFPMMPELRKLSRSRLFKHLLRSLDQHDRIQRESGFYFREKIGKYFSRVFGRWTDQQCSFTVKQPVAGTSARVVVQTLPLRTTALSKLIKGVTSTNGTVSYRVHNNTILIDYIPEKDSDALTLTVNLKSTFRPRNTDTRDLGIFVTRIVHRHSGISIRNLFQATASRLFESLRYYNYLDSYDVILVNSQYTRAWLKKLWDRDAAIVYPSVDVESFTSSPKKKNILLSVGRFFEGSHNKKHLMMIRAFKELYLMGRLRGWEYHLCGGTHPEPQHQAYLKRMQLEAIGYPIYIHADIPATDLLKLYSDAQIFWHAAGYGEDEEREPDKFEHFGITTVEAMAAGCIPVVIGKAGQLEIVRNDVNGFTWQTPQELQEQTLRVIQLTPQRKQILSQQAIQSASQFSREACEQQIQHALQPLIPNLS